jgi:7-carboxy-7-deazaguanine synthase
MMYYNVSEIYDSISGEAPTVGEKATFIRLHGCPLKCEGCDTAYAFGDDDRFNPMTRGQIIAECHSDLIIITGGEPLSQNLDPLLEGLSHCNVRIQIETSGACPFLGVRRPDILVCSPKPKANWHVADSVEQCVAIYKLVVGGGKDFDSPNYIIRQFAARGRPVYLMPFGAPPTVQSMNYAKAMVLCLEADYKNVKYSPRLQFDLGVR